ncbi:glycoside hydrolase domain-containing protein [Marmoricola sp. RAF53]|uniref:glycoside hydrolase domain-containing protein n=1 Tax=Marmoricola sp. RAF53 TaxID=3233059 RepID=UPI003F98512C
MLSQPRLRRVVAAVVLALTAGVLGVTASAPSTADAANPITPGNFTGYGFDQCEAPSQNAMTAWLKSSPYRAVGIYISGSLRYCQAQTNLTPTWVRTQLATGWRLLPIHLGAQASCSTRDRYQKNKINPSSTNDYAAARAQGRQEADIATAAAKALGLAPRSTIYYDLESFPMDDAACKASALRFLSDWTSRLTANGYVSGVYSSAASGIKVLDNARVTPGNTIVLPYQIWIADWNGKADTSSTYFRADGWPGRRLHQYKGGHNETYGGVTINIDSNYLDLRGAPYTAPGPATPEIASPTADPKCTTASISKAAYRYTDPRTRKGLHVALQCLLKQRGLYTAMVTGNWNPRTTAGVKAWQRRVGHRQQRWFTQQDWISLLVAGNTGSYLTLQARGADVVRVQRALNASGSAALKVTGVYDATTARAVGVYQVKRGLKLTRAVGSPTWAHLKAGRN